MNRMPVIAHADFNEKIPGRLLNPLPEDLRFYRGQTIFLRQGFNLRSEYEAESVEGAFYNWSDRLYLLSRNRQALEEATKSGKQKYSPAFFEAYLRALFEDLSIELVHIVAQRNRSNGSNLLCYGYLREKHD